MHEVQEINRGTSSDRSEQHEKQLNNDVLRKLTKATSRCKVRSAYRNDWLLLMQAN